MQSAHSSSYFQAKTESKEERPLITQNNITKINNIYITDSEQTIISKQRSKFNLANPEMLFLYRHVPISLLSNLVHICTFLVCLPTLLFMGIYSYQEAIETIGTFSNKTTLFLLYQFSFICLIAWYLRELYLMTKDKPIRRYWVAMASNSTSFALINILKYNFLILIILSSISLSTGVPIQEYVMQLDNGPISDEFEAFDCVISLIIIIYSFRFCKKDLM